MVGINEVAKRAGVSKSTVSNVLNGTKYVSEELRKKVLIAVRELNYKADPIARRMKSRRTHTIGVISADICGLFYPYVIRGIYEEITAKGYQLLINDTRGAYGRLTAFEREQEQFDLLIANRVDGIIFASSVNEKMQKRHFASILKKTRQDRRIPLVSIERDFSSLGIDSVYVDGLAAAQQAVRHLIDCGCRRIAHISGPLHVAIADMRMHGYLACVRENGLPDDESLVAEGDYSHQSGYKAMRELLAKNRGRLPDGVFVANDQMAVGALKCLQEQGHAVPDDIKIIGYDDVFIGSVLSVPLSTVHIQKYHLGKNAAHILLDKIEHPEQEGVVRKKMDSWLVVRKSTRPDAPEDWILNDW